MNTLVCTSPKHLEYQITEDPIPQPGQSIIKIKRIGVCGTDLHAFDGNQPFLDYPRIFGHELSGELVEVNGASGFKIGDAATIIPYFNCGDCIACRQGKPNCCVKLRVCGVHIDGGMREYFSVPSSSLVHNDGLSYDALALVEPLAIGAHGVSRANIQPGEFVLIAGAGPIGLATMEFAKIAGGKVIVADVSNERLKFCKDVLQIEHIINPSDSISQEEIKQITNGNMASVVIDATGNLKAIEEGFSYLSHGGRYVLIGIQKANISFNHPEFHKREATLMSSRNAMRKDFEFVIECIKSKGLDPNKFVNNRIKFGQAKTCFENGSLRKGEIIKTIIELND